MPGKPNAKSKDDLKLTISAIAFTIALAAWNYFSGAARKPIETAAVDPPTETQQPTVGQTQMAPVLIFLGGPPPPTAAAVTAVTSPTAAPPAVIQPTVVQPQPTRKHRKPVARTGSSRP